MQQYSGMETNPLVSVFRLCGGMSVDREWLPAPKSVLCVYRVFSASIAQKALFGMIVCCMLVVSRFALHRPNENAPYIRGP